MTSYANVADLRAEGVGDDTASDARLGAALEEASRTIDRLTGWFFEPRKDVVRLSGRDTPTIELPFPPIALTHVRVGGGFWMPAYDIPLTPELVWIVGAPIRADFDVPRITLRFGYTFPEARGTSRSKGPSATRSPTAPPRAARRSRSGERP